jgi:hypothetical protein
MASKIALPYISKIASNQYAFVPKIDGRYEL